jgi:hypothetical protein
MQKCQPKKNACGSPPSVCDAVSFADGRDSQAFLWVAIRAPSELLIKFRSRARCDRFPPVAEFVTRYVDDGVAVRHAQRMLSRRLDRATSDALSPSLPEALQTRIVSAASPHANAWLAPAPGADAPRWLSPADWDVLIRRRLVLPIAAAPSRCGNCGTATVDVYGDHSVVCMHGPARYKIHNAIRDTTVRVCQEALLSPIVEPELPGGGRGDVLLDVPLPCQPRPGW